MSWFGVMGDCAPTPVTCQKQREKVRDADSGGQQDKPRMGIVIPWKHTLVRVPKYHDPVGRTKFMVRNWRYRGQTGIPGFHGAAEESSQI